MSRDKVNPLKLRCHESRGTGFTMEVYTNGLMEEGAPMTSLVGLNGEPWDLRIETCDLGTSRSYNQISSCHYCVRQMMKLRECIIIVFDRSGLFTLPRYAKIYNYTIGSVLVDLPIILKGAGPGLSPDSPSQTQTRQQPLPIPDAYRYRY